MAELTKILHSMHISLIVLFAFSAILFLTTDLSMDGMVGDLFGQIYDHSSRKAKEDAHSFISDLCEGQVAINSESFEQLEELCSDPERLASLESECAKVKTIEKDIAPSIENCKKVPKGKMQYCDEIMDSYGYIKSLEQPCSMMESGELELMCKDRQVDIYLSESNVKRLQGVCAGIASGEVSERDEVGEIVRVIMPGVSGTGMNPLEKSIVSLDRHKDTIIFASVGITLVLLILLLVLYMPYFLEFYFQLSRIMVRLGIFLALPPLLVMLYIQLVPIDTSWILESIQYGLPEDAMARAAAELMPLAFQSMLPLSVLYLGIVLSSFGALSWYITRKMRKVRVD